MTTYLYESDFHALSISWRVGWSFVSSRLTELPKTVSAEDALKISGAMSILSKHLWSVYENPSSSADSLEPNALGWKLEGNEKAVSGVIEAILNPNLPQSGMLISSYIPIEEAANQVGRVLHKVSDTALTNQIVLDVEKEINAIENASRGDFSGRARQALALTRSDASPAQISVANSIFFDDPLGSQRLYEELDATAAAVVASHWLHAAASITAENTGIDLTRVILEADNIQAINVESPIAILEEIQDGNTPLIAVTNMVKRALAVANGKIPDPFHLVQAIQEASLLAEKFQPFDPDLLEGLMPSLTPLDLSRPAHDLLEDLVTAINACFWIYQEYADPLEESLDDSFDVFDEENYEAFEKQMEKQFLEDTRIEANFNIERIL